MGKHYFPDCNVLAAYLTEYDIPENKMMQSLVTVTKERKFFGHLVHTVENEFLKIFSDNAISKAQTIANRLIEESNNSKPILATKIEKFHSEVRSEEILLKQLKFLLFSRREFNTETAKRFAIQAGFDFRVKREEIINNLNKIKRDKVELEAVKLGKMMDNVKSNLNRIFPIRKEGDEKDNEHIINSAISCSILKTSADFVTNDNLRITPKRRFPRAAEAAKKAINETIGITLEIKQLPDYCKENNIVC